MEKKNLPQVSICIPAYNEGKNIALILEALIAQKTKEIEIHKIVIVSSGSTDDTDAITQQFMARDARVSLIRQASRDGKAAAINAFLKEIDDPIIVIESADTIPLPNTIELLCTPFLQNEKIGLTGGAPIPVNDDNTFVGYIVHTWWWFHRNIPRFGEIIAFRNILPEISATTAVDEAYIQAKLIQQGLKAVHIDAAIVRNKGPETISDLIKQRRRIFNGHSRLYASEGVKIDNMTKSSLRLLMIYKPKSLKHAAWLVGGVIIEVYARLLGVYDVKIKKINPFVWDTATSTKHLNKDGDVSTEIDHKEKILFVNFAPLSFGGGVEKWILSVAQSLSASSTVCVLQVHRSISDLYSRIVLHRAFDERVQVDDDHVSQMYVTWAACIPWTTSWQAIREQMRKATYIYTKLEVNETLLILYFGGWRALRKTIIGLHSPFFYMHTPLTFMERLHNAVYTSFFIRSILKNAAKVHVLNPEQQKKLTLELGLTNTVFIPNFIESTETFVPQNSQAHLKVCFVGELSRRKGADILLDVIKQSPTHIEFEVAGDGPLKDEFEACQARNLQYRGYVDQHEVGRIIARSDVLFLPSRAESFSLASLEALSQGLIVVCSSDISPNTLEKYLMINQSGSIEDYVRILEDVYGKKHAGELTARREATAKEIRQNFSKKQILHEIQEKLFNIRESHAA